MKRIIGLSILAAALLSLAAPRTTSAGGHKVFVNHKGTRICVAMSSVSAHLAHGDVTRFMPCP